MEKSGLALIRFELFPTLANASSFDPMFLGKDVCVVVKGSRADANMIDATGFQRAILDTSWKHLHVVDLYVCN